MAKIKFLKEGITLEVSNGSELSTMCDRLPSLPLKLGCRQGECGMCMIEVDIGAHHLTKRSSQEISTLQRKNAGPNSRLACQCALNGDIEIN